MNSTARVVTLTLHPAIDRVVKINVMQPGGTFDGTPLMTLPAGKGVNTARVVAALTGAPERVVAVAWAGETEASFFVSKLRELSGITCSVCPRPTVTRFAQTYLEAGGSETHIKEGMAAPSALERREFLAFWRKTVRAGDVVAVCGSSPKGTSLAFLKSVFEIAHERGASAVVADTNGAALEAAAVSRLAVLKGNALEIGALLQLGEPFNVTDRVQRRSLLDFFSRKGAPEKVLITLGGNGALLALRDRILHGRIDPEHFTQRIVSTTGCGDAATAGVLWNLLDPRGDDELMLKRAVACGGAKTLSADPGAISLKYARRFVRYCFTKRLDAL